MGHAGHQIRIPLIWSSLFCTFHFIFLFVHVVWGCVRVIFLCYVSRGPQGILSRFACVQMWACASAYVCVRVHARVFACTRASVSARERIRMAHVQAWHAHIEQCKYVSFSGHLLVLKIELLDRDAFALGWLLG